MISPRPSAIPQLGTATPQRTVAYIVYNLEPKSSIPLQKSTSALPTKWTEFTMGREEQVEEREVLDSIFPDEITGKAVPLQDYQASSHATRTILTPSHTDISETEYRILITLDLPDDEEESSQPSMVLTVRYPEDYPDKAPNLDLSPPEDGGPKHPMFDVAEDKGELLSALEPVVEENLGMAMVFTLVTTLKDEAEQLVERRKQDAARAHEEVLAAAEREENKKFHGTPVTRETFLQWRDGFFKEMEEAQRREEEERLAEMKKARIKDPTKLTGRQLWERGLAKGEEVDEAEEGAAPAEEMEKLKVSAT